MDIKRAYSEKADSIIEKIDKMKALLLESKEAVKFEQEHILFDVVHVGGNCWAIYNKKCEEKYFGTKGNIKSWIELRGYENNVFIRKEFQKLWEK